MTWAKHLRVELLKVEVRATVGESISQFLGTLGYLDKVELAFDNEPGLAAGAQDSFAQTMLVKSPRACELRSALLFICLFWGRSTFEMTV